MPPKSARGRKKVSTTQVVQNGNGTNMKLDEVFKNDQNLNHNNLNKLSDKNHNNDMHAENKESNEHIQNLNESSETVKERDNISNSSDDKIALVSNKLKKTENTKEVTNEVIENDVNLKDKVAIVKHDWKEADVPNKNVLVATKTLVSVPVVEESNEKSLTKQSLEISEFSKSNIAGKSRSEFFYDKDETELYSKVKSSDDKNNVEEKKVPLKRGRPKKNVSDKKLQAEEEISSEGGLGKADVENIKEPDENIQKEQLLVKQKIPLKRGRRKANNEKIIEEPVKDIQNELLQAEEKDQSKLTNLSKSDISSDFKKIEVNEEPTKEIPSEELQTVAKVPSKRGRKKANILLHDKPILEKIEEKSNDVTVPSKNTNMPSKRGKKKADQKDGVLDFCKPSQDMFETEKAKIGVKEEKQEAPVQVKKLPSFERKRKNGTSTEEIEKDKHESKILKVTLQRDATLDKMVGEEQTKTTKKGGAKNVQTGGKRANEGDSKESGERSPKMPKGELKSKGQSKKDRMPDVTLIDFGNSSTSPSGKPWNLKISSWNVNGIRAWIEKDGLAYVTHENPDIITFQETKCSEKMLPKEINIPKYHSYWLAGDKEGYSGVGLLSKKKPVSVKYGIGVEEHDNEGRVITAEYDAFYLVSAYVPNSGRGLVRLDYRMQWDKDFLAFIKNLDEKKPVVLCGDLNVAHEEIDLAKPKNNKKNAGFTKEEREGFSALLSEGFIDSFRYLYPDAESAYTFWTYMMNARAKNVGWRLDYFVLSKKLSDHLCDNVIRKDVFGSDHCPITLFLSL